MVKTTIQLTKQTLSRLQEHKRYSRESYDTILNTLLDEAEDETLTADEIADLQEALEQVKRGQVYAIEDVAKDFGVDLNVSD